MRASLYRSRYTEDADAAIHMATAPADPSPGIPDSLLHLQHPCPHGGPFVAGWVKTLIRALAAAAALAPA
jgi:hypothetical protein